MRRAIAAALIVISLTACGSLTSPGVHTGITGTVVRGPIAPTGPLGTSCDAPFRGRFAVRQGGTVASTFRSDSAGRFTVYVAPGRYTVTPESTSVIVQQQSLPVTVQPTGLTTVHLTFDTGIR